MISAQRVIATGSPRFQSRQLTQLAVTRGTDAAWAAACGDGIAAAAAGASGDFSVAVIDTYGRTHLAVDRFSIQPLCYRVVGKQVRFAARADALVQAHTEIDPQAIFDYLFFHTIPSPRTIFKDVFRLPPGHCAVFDDGQVNVAPYWVPAFGAQASETFADLRAEFLDLLRRSVADQLDGTQAACYLSGGTDSSTVAGMIASLGEGPAATYSIGFDANGYDEMAYARIAAKRYGTVQHEYYVTPQDLVQSIARVATHYDQPFGNSSALPAYYCAAMARADGVTRILAGDGGDELFGGNTRYATQRIFNWYATLPHALRTKAIEPMLGHTSLRRLPLLRKAASYVDQASTPMPMRLHAYNLLNRLGPDNVLTPEFLNQVNPKTPLAEQERAWQLASTDSQLQRNLAFDWRYTLAENDLPKVCGTARLAGIEAGFPLLDQRLLDFSLKLPERYKVNGSQLRWFFKEALRDFLPDEILTKQKHGFGLPFGVWACRHPGLQALARDSLQSLGERGVVRPNFINTLLTHRLPQHPGYYGEMVWILMMLEQWLRQHAPTYRIDSPSLGQTPRASADATAPRHRKSANSVIARPSGRGDP